MAILSCIMTVVSATSVEYEVILEQCQEGWNGTRYIRFFFDDVVVKTVQHKVTNGGAEDSFYGTITGLDPNTRYSWEAQCGTRAGAATTTTWHSALVDSGNVRTWNPPTLSMGTITTFSLELEVDPNSYNYFKYSLKYYGGSTTLQSYPSSGFTTSTSVTFSGLEPGTRYSIFCGYSNDGVYSEKTISIDPYTYEKPSLYEVEDETTSTSVTVAVSNYSDFTYFKYSIKNAATEVTVGESGAYITAKSYTFTALEPNTRYYVFCNYSNHTYSDNEPTLSLTVYTDKSARPANFEWTSEKKAGKAFNLTATEWNNFTSRVNEFRVYKNLSNYSFTKAYAGDTFTAAMYTQARSAIQAIDNYGAFIPTATKGQVIEAYHLNQIRDELNAIP